ncbi:MAG: methylated-DNA--[protein]-cysteine S-methyltransferase [Gammaproteobacteria bacterium]|nr:methylated-DNA--[protein]-cysteine S-methyltransferase [Gammaproteobacteria bacterium]
MSEPSQQRIDQFADLARYIADHADESLPLTRLAARVHLSPSRMQRVFKSIFGITPKKFQQAARSARFRQLLRAGSDVTAAIHEAGYGSTSRLYENAAHNIGMTPKAYRAGGAGETITWACRETVLGPLLMAATDRGVCFAQFGDACDRLRQQLRDEFPGAEILAYDGRDGHELDRWIDALDAYMQNRQPRPDLPLDLRGTAFQVRVWEFLLSLQDGDVASYAEVAAGIERPGAARAAASAIGRNRIAVLVPCHRILRGDGGIGGYRWGVERKRALLDAERARKARG